MRLQIAPDDYLGQARDLVHREFLAGLMIAYAIDENDRYELVRQPVIDSWHVEQPEIETRAIANLGAVSTDIPLERNVGTGAARSLPCPRRTAMMRRGCCRRSS